MSGKAREFFEGKALNLGEAIERRDYVQVAALSKDEQINLDALHKKDMTFGHFALLLKDTKALKVLTQSGASPLVEVQGIGSVFYCAIRAETTEYLKALLDAGVDPNAKDKHDSPMFFYAVTNAYNSNIATL